MKEITFEGRCTGKGAFTQASVYALDGTVISPRTESSKSGNHWTNIFALDEGEVYLILIEDYSNSGKDGSCVRVEGDGELSEIQRKLRNEFEKNHGMKGDSK